MAGGSMLGLTCSDSDWITRQISVHSEIDIFSMLLVLTTHQLLFLFRSQYSVERLCRHTSDVRIEWLVIEEFVKTFSHCRIWHSLWFPVTHKPEVLLLHSYAMTEPFFCSLGTVPTTSSSLRFNSCGGVNEDCDFFLLSAISRSDVKLTKHRTHDFVSLFILSTTWLIV